jgi:hypothetical protein
LPDGATLRGTFVIDPDGMVRHMRVNDLEVGRDFDEVLRVLRALRTGGLRPAGNRASRRWRCPMSSCRATSPRSGTRRLIRTALSRVPRLRDRGPRTG